MSKTKKAVSTKTNARRRRPDLVRVDVRVRKEDAALVRRIARMLTDPTGEARARTILRQSLTKTEPPLAGLKALLAAAPLDGIDLRRDHRPQ